MIKINQGKYGPLQIAEIGGNHEGDFIYAQKLTQLAIESKADCIKFQIYTGDSLVSKVEDINRNTHFKRFELTEEQHIALAKMVKNAGKLYMASVWDTSAIEWIDPYIDIYKIGSGDLTAYNVIEKTILKNKPLIISTGLATEQEVLDTIHFIQNHNPLYNDQNFLGVLQCTSMYPIEESDANLSVMRRLKELTKLTIGYSDHTIGINTLLTAATVGAEILEYHFTDCKENKEFRDHKVSLTKEDVDKLSNELLNIEARLGSSIKQPVKIETDNQHHKSFRRALYLNKDVQPGDIITENNLVSLRPLNGIDARDYYKLLGKKANRFISALSKLDWEYFD